MERVFGRVLGGLCVVEMDDFRTHNLENGWTFWGQGFGRL